MAFKVIQHRGHRWTGREMYRIVFAYCRDLLNCRKNIQDFFNYVKKIPYKNDTDIFNGPDEIVSRPKFLLDKNLFPALDCKKKGILIASFLRLAGIPFRFLAVSERPDRMIHHVYPQGFVNGVWISFDATYPNFFIGMPKKSTTLAEVLQP